MGRAIHELKIPTKYLFTLIILHIILNPRIEVSTNMSNVVKPQGFVSTKLNDFTVFLLNIQVLHYLCTRAAVCSLRSSSRALSHCPSSLSISLGLDVSSRLSMKQELSCTYICTFHLWFIIAFKDGNLWDYHCAVSAKYKTLTSTFFCPQ